MSVGKVRVEAEVSLNRRTEVSMSLVETNITASISRRVQDPRVNFTSITLDLSIFRYVHRRGADIREFRRRMETSF